MDHSDYDAIMLRLEPWIRETIRDEIKMEKDGVKRDGPTVAEWVAAGYSASSYPPEGYASRSTPVEVATAVAADEAAKKDGSYKAVDGSGWPPGEPEKTEGEFDWETDGTAPAGADKAKTPSQDEGAAVDMSEAAAKTKAATTPSPAPAKT